MSLNTRTARLLCFACCHNDPHLAKLWRIHGWISARYLKDWIYASNLALNGEKVEPVEAFIYCTLELQPTMTSASISRLWTFTNFIKRHLQPSINWIVCLSNPNFISCLLALSDEFSCMARTICFSICLQFLIILVFLPPTCISSSHIIHSLRTMPPPSFWTEV